MIAGKHALMKRHEKARIKMRAFSCGISLTEQGLQTTANRIPYHPYRSARGVQPPPDRTPHKYRAG